MCSELYLLDTDYFIINNFIVTFYKFRLRQPLEIVSNPKNRNNGNNIKLNTFDVCLLLLRIYKYIMFYSVRKNNLLDNNKIIQYLEL